MMRKSLAVKIFSGVMLALVFTAPGITRAQTSSVTNNIIGAIFGTAYMASFDSKEVDFYVGQIFYNQAPAKFGYFDTYSTTFGSDITLFTQEPFNWFVGTERLGRSGSGSIPVSAVSQPIQWNIPACALYSGFRLDCSDKKFMEPYVFCIGGVYALTDLLGPDYMVYKTLNFNVNGTTLGMELGAGFTPLTFDQLQISIEGNYRFENFQNVSYSASTGAIAQLPTGLPTAIDYSGFSFDVSLTFEPGNAKKKEKKSKSDPAAAREKLLAGNIPYNKKAFMEAVDNCDSYVVDLFLKSGFKLDPKELAAISADPKVCDDIKAGIKKTNVASADNQDQ